MFKRDLQSIFKVDNIQSLFLQVSITIYVYPLGIHHYERVSWLKFLIEFVQRKLIYSGHIQTNPKQTISLFKSKQRMNLKKKSQPKGQN